MEPEKKFKLSVSKTKTFLDCKKKYKFAYVIKLPRKEFEYHIFGKFCHKVLEDFHNTYINGSTEPANIVMTKFFRMALKEYQISTELKAEAKNIFNFYLKMISENPKLLSSVLACEKMFELSIEDKVILNGCIDKIFVDEENTLCVADYKTTKNKQYLKEDWFQLLTYAYVLLQDNPDIQKIKASYILLRHNFEEITKEFNRDEILKVGETYLNYVEKIQSEKEYVANPNFMCKYCDFLSECEEGKKATYMVNGAVEW